MQQVVSHNSELVTFLSQLSSSANHASEITSDPKELEYLRQLTSGNGLRDFSQLFDVQDVTKCTCQLIGPKLLPEKFSVEPLEYRKKIENLKLSIRWNNSLEWLAGIMLIHRCYLAVDNVFSLQAVIGSVVRFSGKSVGIQYFCTEDEEFAKVQDVPIRKDVIGMVAALDIANLDYGILVYDNFGKTKIFEIRNNKLIFSAVIDRCKELQRSLLVGKMPHCKHYKVSKQTKIQDGKHD